MTNTQLSSSADEIAIEDTPRTGRDDSRRSPLTLGHGGGSAVISRELATTIQTAPVGPEH